MEDMSVNKDLQNNTTKVSLAEIKNPQQPINKKQQDYIKYVVEELVEETIVDVRDQKIWHPYDSHYSRHLIGRAPLPLYDFVEDKFGILDTEVELVWSQYKNKIKDENGWVQIDPFDDTLEAIRFAMSESQKHNKGSDEFKRIDNPKQHKFYNNIADKVVDLIEVRDQSWGKDIFLTDLLDPDYPGQGMSLPPNINIPDYETFQKRMLTIVHDFFPMLEKYWYIDDLFSNIFILTRFVFPKLWNKFYKGEDQPEESTEYGEQALDYEEDMGKEKITSGSNTSWDDVTNNESIEPINESVDEEKFLSAIVKDLIKNTTTEVSEFDMRTVYVASGNAIFNFELMSRMHDIPNYLSNYIRDTYGLTMFETQVVWLRYRDEIMNMLEDTDSNNPFSISESTKSLPDRIFQMIQDDLFERTVKLPRTTYPSCMGGENLNDYSVTLDDNNEIFPFDQPNFIIQINLPSSEFPYNVELGRERSWRQLNDYLTQQYGLTQEECKRVWDEYRGTICKNAKLPSLYESKDKQQKVLDYALQDLTDNTVLDWGNSPNDTYQIIQFPFSIYPKENSTRLDWLMIDKHNKLDISQFYKHFKYYAKLMYGLTDIEIVNLFPDWEDNIIEKIRDHSETEQPPFMGESKNVISESNIEKLINRLYQEIKDNITVNIEGILLHFPYFIENDPTITYDPFRRDIHYFDHNYVFEELERFVAYHLHKTLDIGGKLQFRNYDPMVKPIVEKLIKDIYIEAINQTFVKPNQVGEKKYNLNESVDWSDKKGNKYHRNGMVNKIVGDFLKMVELTHQSVIFHMTQHMESPQRTHNDPYLTYIYDENGLTQESKDLLYEGLTNGIQWYMEHTGLIDYYPPHSTNNVRPPEDKELIKMIADTLHPIIINAVTDYNEDEGWTMDTLYDGKFLAESIDKQEQYINYAIKHLMDNTKWSDYGVSGISNNAQLLLNDIISMTTYINYGEFEFNFIPHDVADILKGFGLTKQETDEVWDIYSRWILEKVMREGNINWPNKETHKNRYSFLTESKNNSDKFAEKIAKEIIDASTLTGKRLIFYPPIVEVGYDTPISADVNTDWIQRDNSTGTYHLQDDIRRVGRHYIKKILSFGYQERNDPIFKQVNDIVIDNIMKRVRSWDWNKEIGKLGKLKDKHGFIQESAQPKYLDKIFNSIIKEIRFDEDKYGTVVIPFLNKERYSSTTGGLETQEWQISKHDRNIELRTDGRLHKEFKSYIEKIYGLGENESNEIFDRVRQYIKDELYYRSVLQQILWSVQDDYIQGSGAMIDVTSEKTIDLKNYDDFKEYLDWWHGIVEPDDGDGSAEITDNMVKRLYDEIWGILNDSETLMTESAQPNYLKKITKTILDSVETTDDGYIFPDLHYPTNTEDEPELTPFKLKKSGINIHIQPNHILYELFRDKYSDLFGLDNSEIKDLYNMVVDEILRVHRLNNLNEIIIGDFDLDHIPSLIIDDDHLDVEYNLRKYEDYYKLIQDMGYGDDYDPHYEGGKKRYHFEGMVYDDFKPYHEDLLEYLGHHFDFTAA